MGIPPSDLKSTVCFEAPEEPSARQYQNWLHAHSSQSGFARGEHVNVALVSIEAFIRSRGAEGLTRYRIPMSDGPSSAFHQDRMECQWPDPGGTDRNRNEVKMINPPSSCRWTEHPCS